MKSSKKITNPEIHPQNTIAKSSSSNISKVAAELLTPNQENLEAICLTKKRILEGFKISPEDIPVEVLQSQLKKDEILNSLNKRILSLKFKIATKTKSTKEKLAKQKIEDLQKKIENSKADKQKQLSKLEGLKTDWEAKSKSLEEELKKIRIKVSEVQEETELLKEENVLKTEEMKETQNDLKDIKKILKGMTDIYINIQGKMDEKRNEINDLNLKYFGLINSIEDVEELENGYKEIYLQAAKTKQEKEEIQKMFKKSKDFYNKVQMFPQDIEKILENLTELDGFIESIIDEREIERILIDSKQRLGQLKKTLESSLLNKTPHLDNPERTSKIVKTKYKENEKILKDLEKDIQKIDSNPVISTLNDQIKKLANMENQNKQNMENLGSDLVKLKQKMKDSKSSLASILSLNQDTEFEYNQLKTKLDSVNNQLKLAQSFKKNDAALADELKSELASLMKKVEKVKNFSASKEGFTDSRKLKNLVSQVTILHEEIIKKDSQILKRIKDLLKTQKETKKVQKNIEGYEKKINETREELYKRFNEQLEKKNKEIDMLKGILKGNTNEIRAKEAMLFGIKKQLEGSPVIPKGPDRKEARSK